ncbi:MAG: right-handed parallel beta-helix repeat-containing protein [Phycisphaerae bacterium]|nr:right-handed parallel beta-helix repeat-containing protein [Phycisphaerae bacterium]
MKIRAIARTALALLLVSGGYDLLEGASDQSRPANFYVSPKGNDANPGTLLKPFATLQRARDAVRQLNKAGQKQDVLVLIRGGTYYLPQGVTFGPTDSGTEKYKITYAAYPGETPTLLGGVRLGGWKKHKGNVYAADLPDGVKGTQLFEDARRLNLARAPNAGYFKLEKAAEAAGKLAFVYRTGDIDPAGWDVSEAMVNIWPYHNWFNSNYRIKEIDAARRLIVLDMGARELREGNRFYVKNVLSLLDEPGECSISLKNKKVYAWPRGKGIDQRGLIISTAQNVLSIRGQGGRIVRNLHFEGLDICICENDAISISGAEDCSVRFCKIENAGVTGVVIGDHAQRIVIYGNLIRRHGQHGVSLRGRGPSRTSINHRNLVENNHIHHCGRLIGHGYGVRISQSGHNKIIHNHIHHMPRYGTTIKGSRYGTIKGKIEGMTWENRYDFMHGRNNLIAYNDIHHTNMDSQDTGAMESWGAGRDNKIDHNLIHDTGNTEFNLQSGIYLDDQADYFIVTNNIIYGVTGTDYNQCIYAKGIGNRIENNILIGSSGCDVGIRSFFMADERCDHHEYLRNIIYFEQSDEPPVAGTFGSGVGNLQNKGSTLTWRIKTPADGRYDVWIRYACHNEPYGVKQLDGRMQIRVDNGQPAVLNNLPDTGGWGIQRWSKAAKIALTKGSRAIEWKNVKGSGINLDAIVLSSDPAWKPNGTQLQPAVPGKHIVVIQAESFIARDGVGRSAAAYGFVNWSDDRVTASEENVFYKPGGSVNIKGGPADGSIDKWREILDKKFDQKTLIADPLFVDVANRDFRLKLDSPALKLGFRPIDVSRIGLKNDFPARFETD